MYAQPLAVCNTCMLVIANGSAYDDHPGDEGRSAEAMSGRGPFTMGDEELDLGFVVLECDDCGAPPGERRVVATTTRPTRPIHTRKDERHEQRNRAGPRNSRAHARTTRGSLGGHRPGRGV